MSQKKVDSYKAGKAGRSKASRKEKLIDKLEILAWLSLIHIFRLVKVRHLQLHRQKIWQQIRLIRIIF